MRVAVLEDDPSQVRAIENALKELFSGCEVLRYSCGSELHASIEDLLDHPPDLFVLDVVVAWETIERLILDAPDLSEPPEDYKRGFGGLWFQKRLRQAGVEGAIILFTVLEEETIRNAPIPLDEKVCYLPKSPWSEHELLRRIQDALK